MNTRVRITAGVLALSAAGLLAVAVPGGAAPMAAVAGPMAVDDLELAPTQNEINSFKSHIAPLTPAPDNVGNDWAQHAGGQRVKAMGILYEISGDTAILDKMIGFCDAVHSQRNDLAAAPVGQHRLWTGGIDPAWPNNRDAPVETGGEQGDPVGHLGYCARLILETPAIWNRNVSFGDPRGYGATYLARAKTFLASGDRAVDGHILSRLLDLTRGGNRQYFARDAAYQPGGEVPWNQQAMFNYGFHNLAAAHRILNDAPARVTRYEGIVKASVDWFFAKAQTVTSPQGRPAYRWGYKPSFGTLEDNSHGQLDVHGLHMLYASGRYGITAAMMTPLANTFLDIMTKSSTKFSGKVDGTDGTGNSAPTSYIRAGWLLLAEFRTDRHHFMMDVNFNEGGTTGSIDQWSRLMLVKDRRW
ncbi:hypothetical protein ACIBEJ_25315 [Nonomuraea sp. NPDC050790]|uniref:hypothetical protein n=1 Tax=Nonomuraea sp. NPDC050790 TaxID=3364371 RepID=UPI0037A26297